MSGVNRKKCCCQPCTHTCFAPLGQVEVPCCMLASVLFGAACTAQPIGDESPFCAWFRPLGDLEIVVPIKRRSWIGSGSLWTGSRTDVTVGSLTDTADGAASIEIPVNHIFVRVLGFGDDCRGSGCGEWQAEAFACVERSILRQFCGLSINKRIFSITGGWLPPSATRQFCNTNQAGTFRNQAFNRDHLLHLPGGAAPPPGCSGGPWFLDYTRPGIYVSGLIGGPCDEPPAVECVGTPCPDAGQCYQAFHCRSGAASPYWTSSVDDLEGVVFYVNSHPDDVRQCYQWQRTDLPTGTIFVDPAATTEIDCTNVICSPCRIGNPPGEPDLTECSTTYRATITSTGPDGGQHILTKDGTTWHNADFTVTLTVEGFNGPNEWWLIFDNGSCTTSFAATMPAGCCPPTTGWTLWDRCTTLPPSLTMEAL